MVLATLVLFLSLGGLLQPGLSGPIPPTPRSVALKPTPKFSPSPAPAIVAPAMTRRAAPTSVVVAPAPTQEGIGILSPSETEQAAYPEPKTTPWIGATVPAHKATPATTQTELRTLAPLWQGLEIVGLSLLGLLLGLTWISYRRERRFFA
jgi:hypothetical protein